MILVVKDVLHVPRAPCNLLAAPLTSFRADGRTGEVYECSKSSDPLVYGLLKDGGRLSALRLSGPPHNPPTRPSCLAPGTPYAELMEIQWHEAERT